jgi:hypothetical protein
MENTEPMTATTPVAEVKKEESLLLKLIPPHSVISRKVEEKDLERVIEDSVILYNLCHTKSEFYNGAYATSHPQIIKDDPLCFFVTQDRQIIINPVITRHSNYFKDSREACMTFLTEKPIMVPRWQKCEVTYQTIMVDPKDKEKFKLTEIIEESLSGHRAAEFQHEIDHQNCLYIYLFNKE